MIEILAAVTRYADDARLLTEERDKSIVKARAAGATLRQIADAAGLTPSGIAKILRKLI